MIAVSAPVLKPSSGPRDETEIHTRVELGLDNRVLDIVTAKRHTGPGISTRAMCYRVNAEAGILTLAIGLAAKQGDYTRELLVRPELRADAETLQSLHQESLQDLQAVLGEVAVHYGWALETSVDGSQTMAPAKPATCGPSPVAPLVLSEPYQLPENAHSEWAGYECFDYQLKPRQVPVAAAVQSALDAGLYYTTDVHKHCLAILKPTEVQTKVGLARNEGGEFGMDLYYARGYLRAQQLKKQTEEATQQLRPRVGMQLGVLTFNDFKQTTGCFIHEMDGASRLVIQGKRGKNTVRLTCSVLNVKSAMDRAFDQKRRKLGFEAFVASIEPAASTQVAPSGQAELLV